MLVKVEQHDRLSLNLAQGKDHLPHPFAQILPLRVDLRYHQIGFQFDWNPVLFIIVINGKIGLAPAQQGRAFVDGDPLDPCVERGGIVQPRNAFPCFDKGDLQHILRIRGVFQRLKRQCVNLLIIKLIQL